MDTPKSNAARDYLEHCQHVLRSARPPARNWTLWLLCWPQCLSVASLVDHSCASCTCTQAESFFDGWEFEEKWRSGGVDNAVEPALKRCVPCQHRIGHGSWRVMLKGVFVLSYDLTVRSRTSRRVSSGAWCGFHEAWMWTPYIDFNPRPACWGSKRPVELMR